MHQIALWVSSRVLPVSLYDEKAESLSLHELFIQIRNFQRIDVPI